MIKKPGKIFLILLLVLAVISCLPLVVRPDEFKYLYNILFVMNVTMLLSSSWNILGGFAGQVSFGHAGFVGIGAYTVAMLHHHLQWSPWLALPLSGVVAVLGALVVGTIAFRLRGPYFALSTLALAEVAKLFAEGWRSFTQGTQGVVISQTPLLVFPAGAGLYFVLSLWAAGLGIFCALLIKASRASYFFLAVGENEDAALALGIDAKKYKMQALYISSFLAGLSGGFFAIHTGFTDPSSAFDIVRTVEPIFLTMVGGIGTILGPVVGTVLLVPIGEVFRSHFPTAHLLLYGIVLVVFARFIPKGIVGLFRNKRP
jgi:branched-chain amino acid transport system permease protein